MNSTAVAENTNRMSKEELLELKEAMNQKALTKKRIKTEVLSHMRSTCSDM